MGQIPKRNITIYRGDDYVHEVRIFASDGVTPVNITGRTYAVQIRPQPGSTVTVLAFTTALTTPVSGVWQFSSTHTQNAALTAAAYVYDVQETNGSLITTLFKGHVTVEDDVTS